MNPKLPVYSLLILLLSFTFACQEQQSGNTTADTPQTSAAEPQTANTASAQQTILFYGNSLTAGYGLASPSSEAFPALIQQKIDSAGWNYTVINSGLSGETSAGGKDRINWVLRQPVDVFVLELGANDGLRGIDLNATKQNLQAIIDAVRTKYPDATIVLAGMQMPPNLGPDYTAQFQAMYQDLARENNTELIPFLLEGVAGDTQLNQPDGIHPTAEGNRIIARNVWEVLAPVLRQRNA